jgi:hypothetical protein
VRPAKGKQALADLSAEEVRKAEELGNWDFVKDRNDIQNLRDHLARFPGGTTERCARDKLDGLAWAELEKLRAYLDEFPKGASVGAARERATRERVEAERQKARPRSFMEEP